MKTFNTSGQGLIEFMLTTMVLTTALLASGKLVKSQWDRFRCSNLAFEAAHGRLVGAFSLNPRVQVSEGPDSVTAVARCNELSEQITLPRLEPI